VDRVRSVAQAEKGAENVSSAQIVLTDPINLGSEARYQRVVALTLEQGAGEIRDLDGDGVDSSDGVAVGTESDGNFPVFVKYGSDGVPIGIEIDLTKSCA
jgi:hypothetical protein